MKFSLGDEVRVRKDLKVNEHYGETHFTAGMEKYKGMKTCICTQQADGSKLLEGARGWFFSDEMLEPCKDEPKELILGLGQLEETFQRVKRMLYIEEECQAWKNAEAKVEYDKNLKCHFLEFGRLTYCFRECGIATRHPDDKESKEIGRALAYKRMMMKEGK